MGNLVACRMVRLYGISKKSGKSDEFKLVPFKNDAFNENIDESELSDTLTDLAKDLYGQDGCRWFQAYFENDEDLQETESFCFEIDYDDRLEIRNLIDLIDSDTGAGYGCFRYFILVNGSRSKYDWVVVSSLGTIYSS